jgi:hypothetical protein
MDLHIQGCNTGLYQKSIVNMGVKLYNKLRERLKGMNSFQGFKKEAKFLLINNSFYIIEEILQSERL